jgi:hypothetical protein
MKAKALPMTVAVKTVAVKKVAQRGTADIPSPSARGALS